MADEYVIDTNVWVMVSRSRNLAEVTSLQELDCIRACRAWLKTFAESRDVLIVDIHHRILLEYRQNIPRGSFARDLLNRLERQPRDRIIDVVIKFDDDGFAILPAHLQIHDREDRKFVAVALERTPRPPIINATDDDWLKDQTMLREGGILIEELCIGYVQEKHARKSQSDDSAIE